MPVTPSGVFRRPRNRLVATALLAGLVIAGCSGSDDGVADGTAAGSGDDTLVVGPLCDQLPSGDQPGAPALLLAEPADEALTWIPVAATFEAGTRAAEMTDDLAEAEGITILAPTDDAFDAAFTRDTLDDLLLFRQDELGALIEAHIIEGVFSLSELLAAGTVITLAGDTFTVEPVEGMARFDDRAETVCADYRVANAAIHVIDGVLGDHPEQTPPGDLGTG